MQNILTRINACEQCDLCKNMIVSPIAPKIFGKNPEILVVISQPVESYNDKNQIILSPIDEKILKDIFLNELKKDFILTFRVKCISNKKPHTKGNYSACGWIHEEILEFKPKHIILMGDDRYLDFSPSLKTESPHRIFLSKIKTEVFINLVKGIL